MMLADNTIARKGSQIDLSKKQHSGMSFKRLFSCAMFIWAQTPGIANSQPLIEELQSLNFGTLAISANTSVSRFNYPQTGRNITTQGQFLLIAQGVPGQYLLSGFPAFTPLTVSLNTEILTATGNGIAEPLTVDNYDVTQPTTDAQGNAELSLGARLSTSGNGNSYPDSVYAGTTTLRIDYWQPDVNSFVFNSRIIDLETELRSTVALNEVQTFHFGTLFARTSSTEQATLTLAPSGEYTISEPEGTRFVVLKKPEQGVIRVSGAAPFRGLTITSQTADVFLTHKELQERAPVFILSDISTLPNATGTVDANGELLVSIGGTLKTEITSSVVVYPDGEYEGTYELTVSY